MGQSRVSWLQGLAIWLSGLLLTPSRRRSARLQGLLRQRLQAVLQPLVGEGEAGLAILEGALALAEADGHFRDEEWALFEWGMACLKLPDQQRQRLSTHGSIDLRGVCASLSALEAAEARRAIAGFYALMVAADGEGGTAERALLRPLLKALDAEAVEAELPQLQARYRSTPGWLERSCTNLGESLARWAVPRRRRA